MNLAGDGVKYVGLRKRLVEELREIECLDDRVLKAIETIPRHIFMDNAFHHNYAYSNTAFPIGCGQTISHPYTVAKQTTLLQVQKGDKVLEVGTGSGYQTLVLAEMGAKVFSIERQRQLYEKTKKLLTDAGVKVRLYYGDGYAGIPVDAPFDKIIVTAGAPHIPEQLKQQLKVGGIMVIPVGESDKQMMLKLVKISHTEFVQEEHGLFSFVPLLENKQPG